MDISCSNVFCTYTLFVVFMTDRGADMDLDTKKIGSGIKRYRLAKNLSQQNLAEKVGISYRYVAEIESGGKVPKLKTFISILNALDASADNVLTGNLNESYHISAGRLEQEIDSLSAQDRNLILTVVKTMVKNMKQQQNS